MTLLPVILLSCLCTLGGASFRAVDVWDSFYASQEKRALRGSLGKPKDIMPSLPAAVHRVDSADIVPSVASRSFRKGNEHIAAVKEAGWLSASKSK